MTQEREPEIEPFESTDERCVYEPPRVTVLGTLIELTRGAQGAGADAEMLGSL